LYKSGESWVLRVGTRSRDERLVRLYLSAGITYVCYVRLCFETKGRVTGLRLEFTFAAGGVEHGTIGSVVPGVNHLEHEHVGKFTDYPFMGWHRAFFEGHRPICLIDYFPAQSHGIPPSNHIIVRVVFSKVD
jgi:hypothetical protein